MKVQLPRITGFLLALGAASALAADPELPPVSDWGQTQIAWEKQGTHQVLGRATGGECGFGADVPTVVGAWEGDMLVGTVRLCQRGAGCRDRAFPLFAFFNIQDGTLTADVPLDSGCSSPLVKEGRISMAPHPVVAASRPADDAHPTREVRHAKSHLELGNENLKKQNGRQALVEFERALAQGEDAFTAYLGRGEAEVMLGRPQKATRDYRRALAIKPDGVAFYNLACALSRMQNNQEALDNLKRAVDYGFVDRVKLLRDPDLIQVRELPGFQQVLAELHAKSGR